MKRDSLASGSSDLGGDRPRSKESAPVCDSRASEGVSMKLYGDAGEKGQRLSMRRHTPQ